MKLTPYSVYWWPQPTVTYYRWYTLGGMEIIQPAWMARVEVAEKSTTISSIEFHAKSPMKILRFNQRKRRTSKPVMDMLKPVVDLEALRKEGLL